MREGENPSESAPFKVVKLDHFRLFEILTIEKFNIKQIFIIFVLKIRFLPEDEKSSVNDTKIES